MKRNNIFYLWGLLAMLLTHAACEQEELLDTPELSLNHEMTSDDLDDVETVEVDYSHSPAWRIYYTGFVNGIIDDNEIVEAYDWPAVEEDWTADNTLVINHSFRASGGDSKDDVVTKTKSGALVSARFGGDLSEIVNIGINIDADLNRALFGDFNGDGETDIVQSFDETPQLPSIGSGSGLYITTNEESFLLLGRWKKFHNMRVSIADAKAGDFNGDGFTDIMVYSPINLSPSPGQSIINQEGWYVLFGASNGYKSRSWHKVKSTSRTMKNVYIGDFNGDGKDDVFTRWGDGFPQGEGFYVTYGAAGYDTDYGPYVKISDSSLPFGWLRFGDFDGDGKDDVMISRETGIYVNYTGGEDTWELLPTENIHSGVKNLIVGDFNGDGKDDIIDTDFGGLADDSEFPYAICWGDDWDECIWTDPSS